MCAAISVTGCNMSSDSTASPPPYQPSLVIDCGVLIVTVYGQPSREDAEYMAEMMRAMVNRLNYEKP